MQTVLDQLSDQIAPNAHALLLGGVRRFYRMARRCRDGAKAVG